MDKGWGLVNSLIPTYHSALLVLAYRHPAWRATASFSGQAASTSWQVSGSAVAVWMAVSASSPCLCASLWRWLRWSSRTPRAWGRPSALSAAAWPQGLCTGQGPRVSCGQEDTCWDFELLLSGYVPWAALIIGHNRSRVGGEKQVEFIMDLCGSQK